MKAEQRFDYVEKEIETAPIEIELEFVSPYMKGSTLKQPLCTHSVAYHEKPDGKKYKR